MRIDLRSDTVTQPSSAMREVMMNTQVGDDVMGEDDATKALEAYAASLFGMDSALFCPSGTMTNQIAINVHTRPGDEVICASEAHIYFNEGGGIALNSGVSARLVACDRGRLTPQDIRNNINADDVHYAHTSLVCVENTMNRGGGAVYSLSDLYAMSAVCKENQLAFHCDGARLFNALVADGSAAAEHGAIFDSISICLSKGLGAPVGSLLLGSHDFIHKAMRRRKSMGGGMRQTGFLAAAGLYALKNNVHRLKDDHLRAQLIGQSLSSLSWVKEVVPVETNIVIVQVNNDVDTKQLIHQLAAKDILCFAMGSDRIRFVTHLDFGDEHLDAFQQRIQHIV